MSQQKPKRASGFDSPSGGRWRLHQEHRSRVAAFFGELVGTAMFVLIDCLGCVQTPIFNNTHFQSGLTFGLAILIAIQCFGSVSGAHLNPAITLAATLYGVLHWGMAIAYFVAQVAGAFIGYGLLVAVLPHNAIKGVDNPAGVCVTVLASDISVLQGLFIEFLITCCVVMVACSLWDPRNAKLKDSVPVRFGSWEHHWIYWVGPLVVGAVTSLIYRCAFKGDEVIELRSSNAKIRVIEEVVLP
ncbi:aquaporin AQPcic-like [Drosophila miranda]|uniref:aquaporin AQPcic-like n=1 Tax=Drosophila miranda TaxID=7229 RepID=UPI00143F0AC8|nr:aquaporin AQPcic-like [Drosophila miranda]